MSDASVDRPTNARIPFLLLLAPLLILGVWLVGTRDQMSQRALSGHFPLGPGIKRVRIEVDHAEMNISHGAAGKLAFRGKALVVAKTQALLAQGQPEGYRLVPVETEEKDLLLFRVPPIPAALQAPGATPEERHKKGPKLFREMKLSITLPVDIALEYRAVKSHLRVDTRQADVDVKIEDGSLMVMRTRGSLKLDCKGGKVIVENHRGPLVIRSAGQTRVGLDELAGPIDMLNAAGESDVTLPPHAACELVAKSLESRIHNAFGLSAGPHSGGGQLLEGKLGKGTYKVLLVNQAGTLTLRKGD